MKNFLNWLLLKENFLPNNPQDREEFLRDVIAIIQGQESPNFYIDQNLVMKEVQKRISSISNSDPKAKRMLLRQLESEWQQAKQLC